MPITLEQFCEILDAMTIEQSVDAGFAVTHFGHVAGQRTVAISTCRGDGECFLIQ